MNSINDKLRHQNAIQTEAESLLANADKDIEQHKLFKQKIGYRYNPLVHYPPERQYTTIKELAKYRRNDESPNREQDHIS